MKIFKPSFVCIIFIFFNLYLLIWEKHWLAIPPIYAFIGWFLYVPWPGIESTTMAYQVDALTTWATRPGPHCIIFEQSSTWVSLQDAHLDSRYINHISSHLAIILVYSGLRKNKVLKQPKSKRRNWSLLHGKLNTGIGESWVFNNNYYGASDIQ